MRVFLDFTDGPYTTHDRDGIECANADEARLEALRALPEVLMDEPQDADEREVTCSVRDKSGAILYRASVTLKGQRSPDR